MSQIKVSYKRHLAKTISYRILSTSIGFLAMWWASGSIKVGAAFGVVELIYKPLQYYVHERVWYKWIKFGLVTATEKKKKNSGITEGKTKEIVKEIPQELPETLPPPQPKSQSEKKVLSYSSNR
jgi:uncharacterized membrane protein